jgi:hypothetical protein
MALVVEDGTGVAGADSYADLTTLRAYAAKRGVTLSADDATLGPLAYKAMDYLEGQGVGLLSLTWPSETGRVCGMEDDAALLRLANAQAQLCIEQHAGVDLTPARTGDFIVEDTVGPITTKYSDKFGPTAGTTPAMPAVAAILKPFRACGHFGLKTIRV